MKNLNNYTQDEIDSLIYLLNQEFSVLSRIDLNSDLGINQSIFHSKNYTKNLINQQRLIALELSKKIAFACHLVMSSIYSNVTKDEAKTALLEVLNTNIKHNYTVSALWNLDAMYKILNTEKS